MRGRGRPRHDHNRARRPSQKLSSGAAELHPTRRAGVPGADHEQSDAIGQLRQGYPSGSRRGYPGEPRSWHPAPANPASRSAWSARAPRARSSSSRPGVQPARAAPRGWRSTSTRRRSHAIGRHRARPRRDRRNCRPPRPRSGWAPTTDPFAHVDRAGDGLAGSVQEREWA